MSPDHENRDASLATEEAARLALAQLSAELAQASSEIRRATDRGPGHLLAKDLERASGHVTAAMRRAEAMRGEVLAVAAEGEKLRARVADLEGDLRGVHRLRDDALAREGAKLAEIEKLRSRIDAAFDLLAKNGDNCECDHTAEEHDDTCDRCLACRIESALKGETV